MPFDLFFHGHHQVVHLVDEDDDEGHLLGNPDPLFLVGRLDTAQDLAERLRARLQDEQGLALGAMQLENLRRTVQDLTSAERAEPTA